MAPAPATLFPDMLLGCAGTMTAKLETSSVEELMAAPEDASNAIRLCAFFREQFARARQLLIERLSRGVEGRSFADKFEERVRSLAVLLSRMADVVTKLRTDAPSRPVEEVVASFRALMDEMLSYHELLSKVVTIENMPLGPVDWDQVREAGKAYARGETKPFRRLRKN